MITRAEAVAPDAPAFAAAAEQRIASAGGWLRDRRQAGWDAFTTLPMPSSRSDEDWRRTDISKLRLGSFTAGAAIDEHLVAAVRLRRDRAAANAALVIDAPPATRIEQSDELAAAGVVISSLDEAASLHPELVERALSSVSVGESAFVALWNAMWAGGAFIYVPHSVNAAVPVWVAHSAAGDHAAVFPATVVLLEDNASLTLIDDYVSAAGSDEVFSDALTVVVAGRDSRLDHCVLQQWGENAWHIALHRTVLGQNARLRMFGGTLGSRLQKAYWEVLLEGTGAEAEISGVAFGDAAQHLDHQSLQAHRAAHTTSRLKLKVAVRGTARSVYSGLIDVDRTAQQTDAYVQNRNLILSHGATADSVPRLEIRANDVRCGHGATAGHIDDDHRFYLMARGVSEEDADRLIVRGFLDDALAHCPHQGVADLIGDLLDHELAGDEVAGVTVESMKVATWVEIGRVEDVPPGHAARVEIGEVPVAVFNVDGEFFCLDDTCSHAEASLSDGDLDPSRCAIECPLHGSSFDLRTGEPLSLPAVEPVAVHHIDTSDGVIRVALRDED